MNKKVLIAIVVALGLVVVVGAAALLGNKPQSENPKSTDNGSVVNAPAAGSEKTLGELLGAGQSQKCSYSYNDSGTAMKGVAYIDSGKMRADVELETQGMSKTSHMIVDGSTSYVWMDNDKTGFKMSFDVNKSVDNTGSSAGSQALDPTKKMNYNCSAWVADRTLFSAPSDVEFSDFGSIMTSGVPGTSGYDKCAACATLTGETKQSCLTALGCSSQ